MDRDVEDKRRQAEIIRAVVGVAFLWFLFVVATGLLQMRNGGDASYAVTGQFGDSFGFIGAIMASTAAYFAYRTYQAQSEETRLLRSERREAAKLRAEPSFLNLLERRYDALKQLSYEPGSKDYRGQEAVDKIVELIEYWYGATDDELLVVYKNHLEYAKNYEHYFRFIYHIVMYAERNFGSASSGGEVVRGDLSYQYVRLLRSQLSDGDLFLLAMNVLTPEGAGAKVLYERYALFHNLSEVRKNFVRAAGKWDERAFGLPAEAGK